MQKLIFKRLIILSDSTKKANEYTFSPSLNLITGKNNSLGKSYLAKMLFWTLGCDLIFDKTWQNLDIKGYLSFSVNSTEYVVCRYKNIMYLSKNGVDFEVYNKITGRFAKEFAEIIQSGLLFKNKSSKELETPPPAFYFLPYYIDQSRGWTEAWGSFENLSQYDLNQRKKAIKYYTGYIDDNQWSMEVKLTQKETDKQECQLKIDDLNTTISTFEEYLPDTPVFDNTEELEQEIAIIEEQIYCLKSDESSFLEKFTKLQCEKSDLQIQISIADSAISELNGDYTYSIENESSEIECPVCGVVHDNSVLSKTDILVERDNTTDVRQKLSIDLEVINKKIGAHLSRLNEIRDKISLFENKYKQLNIEMNAITSLAITKVKVKVSNVQKDFVSKKEDLTTEQKEIKKEMAKLISKKTKDELNTFFITNLLNSLNGLGVETENLADVKSPLDYKKAHSIGGAAEQTRAVCAYYFACLKMISKYSPTVKSAFVVDTPNQQEQANFNYEKIISMLLEITDSQVILCALENDVLKTFRKNANVIELDENKLLSKDSYNKISSEIGHVFRTIPN